MRIRMLFLSVLVSTFAFATVPRYQQADILISSDKTKTWPLPSVSGTLAIMPAGTVVMYGGSSAPTGWLLCDGSAVSRSTYSALFAVVSTTYGVGDGTTTFSVPDARGVFVRGTGSQTISGSTYTGTQGTSQKDQFQDHAHSSFLLPRGWNQGSGGAQVISEYLNLVGSNYTFPNTGGAVSGNSGTETRPANIVLTYIIKT